MAHTLSNRLQNENITLMNEILRHITNATSLDGKRVAVLIRHGERGKIPEGKFGNELPLTPNGTQQSLELGRALARYPVTRIITSPILRCVQTAEALRSGIEKPISIVEDTHLGNPGFHISDPKKAGRHYIELGGEKVFEKFILGENLEGISDASYLRTTALEWLKSQANECGISIFVTHDALIAHFAFANGIKTYSRENWIGFLDGVVIGF